MIAGSRPTGVIHDLVDPCRSRIRHQEAQDPSRSVSGEDGCVDPVEAAGKEAQQTLPQGRYRSAAIPAVDDASRSLPAAVLQSERSAMEEALYEIESMHRFAGPKHGSTIEFAG